jgi:hypothetical protein
MQKNKLNGFVDKSVPLSVIRSYSHKSAKKALLTDTESNTLYSRPIILLLKIIILKNERKPGRT